MKFTCVLLSILIASPAYADGLKYVPKWEMVNGKACYEFFQAKELVKLDADLQAYADKELIWAQMRADLEDTVIDLDKALNAEKSAGLKRQANIDDLVGQLTKEITRANKAEAQQMPSVGWLVAGGVILMVLGAVGGILVYEYVKK
jgi:hypothetical protein